MNNQPHRVDFHRPTRPVEGCTINVHPDPTPTDELAEAEHKRLLKYVDAARRWIDAYPPKAT